MPRLISNEVDDSGRNRFVVYFHAYLPPHLFKESFCQCTNVGGAYISATNMLQVEDGYEKVLVDAPCSLEMYIIHAQNKATASGSVTMEMMKINLAYNFPGISLYI